VRLSDEVALGLNPVMFAQSLGITLDPWQRELMLSTEKRIILNCARQTGKTQTVALMALHYALNNPRALVLVLSPSLRQSGELFKKIIGFYKDLGKPVPSDIETALTLQLRNRSRIVALPGKEQTVRGFSGVDILLIDEASQTDPDLYFAVRPMLAVSDGRLILLSTPRGKRGFFYHEWSEGGPSWKRIMITAEQCPRISKDFLEESRLAMGDFWYESEFCCQFRDNVEQYFSTDEIMNAVSSEVKPLFGSGGELNI
jgi:hypothetical protein